MNTDYIILVSYRGSESGGSLY